MKKLLVVVVVLMLAAPVMADPVTTEMTQMLLTGPNPFGGADITVTMDPSRRSMGQVADDTNFPAESYFDIFVRVDIPGYKTYVLEISQAAVHMLSDIGSIPPAEGAPYVDQGAISKLLASEDDQAVNLGTILEVVHYAGGLTDSLVLLPDGRTEEHFVNSQAQIIVQLDEFGPDELTIDVAGTYAIAYGEPVRVPSINAYGILILTLLLLTTGVYVYYRRRRETA